VVTEPVAEVAVEVVAADAAGAEADAAAEEAGAGDRRKEL